MNRPCALALLLLAALAAAAGPARADNTADEAGLRFKRGVEAYRARRFEDALVEFFQSHRLVANRNVLLNIARCYEQLQQFEEAYRYYAEVLAENYKGEDAAAIQASLLRLSMSVALVEIRSDPPGAEIFVDRRDLGARGVTPKTLALQSGSSTVILSMPGYREARIPVRLATGDTARASAALEFIWGRANVVGEPVGAEVRVDLSDGEPQARLPARLQLKPGRHTLYFSTPGYLPAQQPIEVQVDRETQVKIALKPAPPPTGTVVVTANRDGALIEVDGRPSGFTPAVLTLPAGPHRVAVSMADLSTHREEVLVGDGTKTTIAAELHYGSVKTTAASKSETSIEETPASISVITAEEIRAFGYSSLPEALAGVRGLFLSDDRQYPEVGVRGFSPAGGLNNRILVLYDGHAMNDLWAGQAYIGREHDVDLSEVERIEVVRGPASSLFGSSAVFGVINVVPRHRMNEKNVEGTASVGNYGTSRVRGSVGAQSEDGEVLATVAAYRATNDELFSFPAPDGTGQLLANNKDGEEAVHAALYARWKNVTLRGSYNSRTRHLATGAWDTRPDQGDSFFIDRRSFVELTYASTPSESVGAVTARVSTDFTRYRDFYTNSATATDFTAFDVNWGGAEVRWRSPELLGQHVTLGAEVLHQLPIRQESVDGVQVTPTITVLSAFLVDELRLGSRLSINLSARADDYLSTFGLTINPRVAIIARPFAGGVTKLMGGRSFRAPTVLERITVDNVEDKSLLPETILTAELEHSQELTSDLRITGAVFVNRMSDLLYANDEALAGTANATGTLYTAGAEVEVRWQPARLALLTASYSFQHVELSGIDQPSEQQRLRANSPEHCFSLRGMFPIAGPAVVGALEAIYNGPRLLRDGSGSSGELLLLNVGLSGTLRNGALRYWAGARNLLDERVAMPASYFLQQLTLPSYGRSVSIQVTAAY